MCLATLNVLEKGTSALIRYGKSLQEAFNNLFGPIAYCQGFPTRTQFVFPSTAHKALFWQECVKRGVLFGYSNFPMVSHTESDLNKTLDVMYQAATVVKDNWQNPEAALEGSMPVEA